METISNTAPIENEKFWLHHVQMCKESGLLRSEYCRQNGLNYHRFGYWIKKKSRSQTQAHELIAVKIKQPDRAIKQPILCTLSLKGGHLLSIHDVSVLSEILDRIS